MFRMIASIVLPLARPGVIALPTRISSAGTGPKTRVSTVRIVAATGVQVGGSMINLDTGAVADRVAGIQQVESVRVERRPVSERESRSEVRTGDRPLKIDLVEEVDR